MEKFKFLEKEKINHLPQAPGIYAFKKGRDFLYIGKAANIKKRVKNHFQKPGFRESFWLDKAQKIGFMKTPSEIEALILEAKLIKKYQPCYNVMWKDDKNFFFVGITKQDYPRIFITHQTKGAAKKIKIQNAKCKIKPVASLLVIPSELITIQNLKRINVDFIGPFVDGGALKKTLRVLRKIFPYYTAKKHAKTPCPHCHLGLCPGPNPDKEDYQKNIKNLIQVLKGKRKKVLENLKEEMEKASQLQNFEKAAKLRDKIFALEKIISHAKIFEKTPSKLNWPKIEKELQKLLKTRKKFSRIEAYDVSNIQGQEATGSMVTFIKGRPNKNFYRRFKVKISGKPNDTAMIREILKRRFKHAEWGLPDLILIDGGKAQLNAACQSLKCLKSDFKHKNKKPKCLTFHFKHIEVAALAKRKNELYLKNKKKPILLKTLPREIFNLILQLRDEAHRFAIAYHRKLRRKELVPS